MIYDTPKVSHFLLYKLSKRDAEQINRRRTTGGAIHDRIQAGTWPLGAQAHIGSVVSEGDVFPLLVVRVWANEWGPDNPGVNGQVFLDGNDTFWVTSIPEFGKLPPEASGWEGGTFFYPKE